MGTKRYVKVRPVRERNGSRGFIGGIFAILMWPFRMVGWLVASILGLFFTRVLLILGLLAGFAAAAHRVVQIAIKQMENDLAKTGDD